MKTNKILLSLAAGAVMLSACQQLEKVNVNTGSSVPPVLGTYTENADGVTASYTDATFYLGSEAVEAKLVNYCLVIVKADDNDVDAPVESDNSVAGTVKAGAGNIGTALVSLGYEYGSSVNIELKVRARLSSTAKNGYLDSADGISISGFKVAKPSSGDGGKYADYNQASSWGVTGSIASEGINWDKDIAMKTNGTWHVAIGVELTASDQFKFRKDAAWTDNFGAAPDITDEPYAVTLGEEQTAGPGGKNLCVPEDGVYDLLLNPEAGLYKIVVHEEDPFASFSQPTTWSVIGAISDAGINWDGDIAMKSNGTWCVATEVKLAASDQFKFRKDAAWTDNFGAAPEISDEPYAVTLGEQQTAGPGGKNLCVPEDGVYDLLLDPAGAKYLIIKHGDPLKL